MKYNEKPSERTWQEMFVSWFKLQYRDVGIMAIPNGDSRGDTAKSRAIRGGMLKRAGVLAGAWDLFIPGWALWVEMKKDNRCRLSKNQILFREKHEPFGYRFIVGYGFDDAMEKVLNLKKGGMEIKFCY